MVDVIMNHDLDLLHVHYAIPHASAAYMAKKIIEQTGRSVPVITTLHGTDITLVGRDKTYAPVVTFSINESDTITAVSNNLRHETYKSFKITKEIEVIHNFVDVKRFSKKPIDAFRKVIAPNGEKILVHASNFRRVKRVHDVVNIFAEVRKQLPAKLLMVGDGPERPAMEDLVRDLEIFEDVRFLGKQDQMEEILVVSDLFLLPSDYESFGLAALEAMAAGMPVISSNAGGLPEVNIDGVTGFSANVGDVERMSRCAIELLTDEEKLAQFKQQAYDHALTFDIQNIIPKYEKLYSKYCRMDCE
jgi:N-acetyl-alpha-D-glucosaminyl L-malate synthase BshA